MNEVPQFFIPDVHEHLCEDRLRSLASLACRPVPVRSERVYSITFISNGEKWTATVGKQLQGVREAIVKPGRNKKPPEHLTDDALVLAIFPGSPYIVVTNKDMGDIRIRSTWENPFFAGQPAGRTNFREQTE
jgi:hypothetical protein